MVCSTFRALALSVWDDLAQCRPVGHQLGEEAITDYLVLRLKTRLPHQVVTRTFTKPQEGRNGADWEWWLTGPSGLWMGFRVQAKVLDLATDRFEHLHYVKRVDDGHGGKRTDYQCDRLIRDALTSVPPRVPLYAFYTQWSDLSVAPNPCGTFAPSPEAFGCSISSAFTVRRLRTQNHARGLPDVLPYLRPWHCLVCCEGFAAPPGDLPHRAYGYWRAALQLDDLSALGHGGPDPAPDPLPLADLIPAYAELAPTIDPPGYVLGILRGQPVDAPENLRTVTIIRETAP